MKHITSKLLSLLLTLTMLMSMVPAAYATDTESTGMDDVSISGENVEPYEGETETPVSGSAVATSEELATAIANAEDGATITLSEGEFTLPDSQSIYTGKSLTIKAADNAKVSFDMSAAVTLGGAKITFDGITFDYKTNGNYIGLQHADTLVYNNCTINGMVFLYAASETFNGCTFNQTSADAYNVWTYGAKNVAFNGCTFNCVGKSVLLYNEGTNVGTNLTVSKTTFNASAPVDGKAAIEIDTSLMSGGSTVTVDDATTATGFAEGSNSGSTLWNDKKQTADTNKNTTVTVAGKTVFEPAAQSTAVAKVDNVKYETLQAAIDAAKGGSTVRLLDNVTLTETAVFPAGKTVHINLVGHNITANGTALLINGKTDIQSTGGIGTIESTNNVAVAVGDNAKLTVYSGTLKGREGAVITGLSTGATIEIRGSSTKLIATDNAVIAGNGSARDGNPNTILVKGGTFEGSILSNGYIACGIYAPWNDNVTVSGGTFNIANGAGIVARAGTVKVTGGTFNCGDGNTNGWVGDSKNEVPNAALVFDKGANYPALTDESKILVSGGSFSTDPAANGATLYNGYVATQDENGMYGVRKANPAAEIGGVKYDTLQAAINAAQATKGGATITLLKNINTESYYTVNGDNPVTIDLAGYNITGSGISGLFYVTAKGDLTIKGEGTVTAVEDNGVAMAVWVRSPIAKVTLEGGTYKQQITNTSDNHFDLIYVEYGTAYIKGGTYECYTPAWTLNCKDENYQSSEAKIEVTGGTFKGFNPANNTAEGESTSFIPAGYEVVENEDGTFGVTESANYVAAIGETKYTSLAEAIKEATKGATVKLLRDTKENVTIDKMMTLDLNGFTLNGGTEKGKPALTITARTVTIKDSSEAQTGTIMREDTAENSGVSSHYVIDIQGNAWVMFESGNVKNNSGNDNCKGASLVRVGDDSVAKYPGLNIKGGTFTQDNFIVIKVDSGDLFLNGGTLNCANSYAVENWHRATIKGGTVNGNVSSWTYSGGLNSTLTISGGTVNGDVESVSYDGSAGKKASVSITGGTVNGTLMTGIYGSATEPSKEMATIEVTSGTFKNDPSKYVVENSSVTKNDDGTFGVAKAYLAKVGDTSYYTMDEAFKAQTASGAEIVLLRDYTTGSTFNSGTVARVVDLNGHTWTCTGMDANSAAFEINNPNASLTVKNGKIVSSQLVGLIPSAMGGTITYDNSSLTFDGVEMSTTATSGIETNGNNTDDSVTLKNSTLNVPNGFGIYFPSSGTLTIDNSTINAKTMGVQVCAGNLNINDGSKIIVSGDAVPKTDGDGAIQDGAAISIVNRTGYKGLGVITVTGGTFTAKSNAAIKAYKWENQAESAFDASNKVSVSGGTFSSIPDNMNDLCADGYIPVKNEDGYAVQTGTYVASIGTKNFATLAEAIAAAKDGDTVTLLADTKEDVTINKNITLDLNGKTLTNKVGHTITVEAGASLTITGKGTVDNVTHAKAAIVNYGTVVLNGGTYTRSLENAENNKNDAGGNSYYTILNDKGGHMTINEGVTVTNVGHFSSMIRNGGDEKSTEKSTLIITGGTFSGGINTIKNDEFGVLEIKGGSFSNTSQYVVMNWNKADISGGTFEANATAEAVLFTAAYLENRAVGELTITGGSFKTASDAQELIDDTYGADYVGTAAISGGSFSKLVEQKWCALGYEPNTEMVDGMYGVQKAEGNAAYYDADGNLSYGKLETLLRNAVTGSKVIVLENTTADYIRVKSGVTLDLNGKKVTVEGDMAVSTGTIIDSGKGEGALVVSMKALTTSGDNGGYLPLYDSANKAYHFYKAELSSYGKSTKEPGKVKFYFRLLLDEESGYQYFAQGNSHGVEVYVRLRWDGLPENQYWYVPMTAGTMNGLSQNGSNYYMYAYLTGIKILGNVTIYGKPVIKTEAGYTSDSTELSYQQVLAQ